MTTPADRQREASDRWVRDFADLLIVGASDRLDLGDLISAGLATAAREIGGTAAIVAGRPGSWESDLLLRLAMGHLDPTDPHLNARPIGQ